MIVTNCFRGVVFNDVGRRDPCGIFLPESILFAIGRQYDRVRADSRGRVRTGLEARQTNIFPRFFKAHCVRRFSGLCFIYLFEKE